MSTLTKWVQNGVYDPSRVITNESGGKVKVEFNTGRMIGQTIDGAPTTWVRLIFNSDGQLITAYPVANPNGLILGN
jgi:hypothetical protein